jgi:hypothetical protein
MEECADGQFRLLQIHIVLPQMLNGAVEGFAHIFMHLEFPQFLAKFLRRCGPTQPPRDVAYVAQGRGLMAFEDVGIEVSAVATANRLEEVREMALATAGEGADQLAVWIKQ